MQIASKHEVQKKEYTICSDLSTPNLKNSNCFQQKTPQRVPRRFLLLLPDFIPFLIRVYMTGRHKALPLHSFHPHSHLRLSASSADTYGFSSPPPISAHRIAACNTRDTLRYLEFFATNLHCPNTIQPSGATTLQNCTSASTPAP